MINGGGVGWSFVFSIVAAVVVLLWWVMVPHCYNLPPSVDTFMFFPFTRCLYLPGLFFTVLPIFLFILSLNKSCRFFLEIILNNIFYNLQTENSGRGYFGKLKIVHEAEMVDYYYHLSDKNWIFFFVGMALCRIAWPCSSITNFRFPKYPSKLVKFSSLPLSSFSSPCCSSSLASMEAPPEGYRRNVGICLINNDKKIFAASRLDIPDAWQMPQGGIDEGEDPRNAAIRELREETGVSSAEVIAEVPYWLTYDFPPKVREKLNIQWGSDWKGQAQKWFLFKFTGQDREINLSGDGTEKAEFGEWSWMPPEKVIDLAVDFKKPIYKEVLAVFAPHLQ